MHSDESTGSMLNLRKVWKDSRLLEMKLMAFFLLHQTRYLLVLKILEI